MYVCALGIPCFLKITFYISYMIDLSKKYFHQNIQIFHHNISNKCSKVIYNKYKFLKRNLYLTIKLDYF